MNNYNKIRFISSWNRTPVKKKIKHNQGNTLFIVMYLTAVATILNKGFN